MQLKLEFDVDPVAKQRPRMTRAGRVFTPKKTKDFEKLIAELARYQYQGAPLVEELFVVCEFKFKSPKKPAHAYPSRSDLDNYLKSILDAMNNVIYKDDRQITHLLANKRYSKPGITVRIFLEERHFFSYLKKYSKHRLTELCNGD